MRLGLLGGSAANSVEENSVEENSVEENTMQQSVGILRVKRFTRRVDSEGYEMEGTLELIYTTIVALSPRRGKNFFLYAVGDSPPSDAPFEILLPQIG